MQADSVSLVKGYAVNTVNVWPDTAIDQSYPRMMAAVTAITNVIEDRKRTASILSIKTDCLD